MRSVALVLGHPVRHILLYGNDILSLCLLNLKHVAISIHEEIIFGFFAVRCCAQKRSMLCGIWLDTV